MTVVAKRDTRCLTVKLALADVIRAVSGRAEVSAAKILSPELEKVINSFYIKFQIAGDNTHIPSAGYPSDSH